MMYMYYYHYIETMLPRYDNEPPFPLDIRTICLAKALHWRSQGLLTRGMWTDTHSMRTRWIAVAQVWNSLSAGVRTCTMDGGKHLSTIGYFVLHARNGSCIAYHE